MGAAGTGASFRVAPLPAAAPERPPNRESWFADAFANSLLYMSKVSMLASITPRSPSSSSAQALISASSVFLFTFLSFTRSKKLLSEVNRPARFRSSMIAVAAPWPKFLIVTNQKRMRSFSLFYAPFTMVNWLKLSFTDGGNTGMPIRLHSVIVSPIFSTSPESAVSTADI